MTQATFDQTSATTTAPDTSIAAAGMPSIAGVSQATQAAALAECAALTRRRARNFYHGLRLTPEPKRSAIYAVYAWMRHADDIADEAGSLADKTHRLSRFAEWTGRVLKSAHRRAWDPALDQPEDRAHASVGVALATTIAAYGLADEIFTHTIDALTADIGSARYQTERQLFDYCYGVAGTAGLACLTIWGVRSGAEMAVARELALKRGQAFQRTNILRDFSEDFDAREQRIYLPKEAFDKHDISPEELRRWSSPEACFAMVREQAALARQFYVQSDELVKMIEPECAPTLWAMTRIYAGLLDLIEEEPRRIVMDRRIRMNGAKKASIALSAALWAKVGRW